MDIKRKTMVTAALLILALFLCIHYWDAAAGLLVLAFKAASPLFLGCAMAYCVNILMSFYERHYFPRSKKPLLKKSARPVCLLCALLTVAAIIAGVIGLVLPELTECVRIIISQVPRAVEELAAFLYSTGIFSEETLVFLQDIDWRGVLEWCFGVLTRGVSDAVTIAAGVVSSVISTLLTVFIALVFSINLLLRRDKLKAQANRLLDTYVCPKWSSKLRYLLSVLNTSFHSYLVGQCTEAVILGLLCALGMLIFRFPYAVMTGVVVGVTALVPVAGAYIGGAVGFLLILTVSPIKAILFVVYLVILQQLEGNLIYPRVVGSSIGLPGIWVLAAVTVGGGIMGIPGMLIGVPLASAVYQLIKADLDRRAVKTGPGVPLSSDGPGQEQNEDTEKR